MTVMNTLIAQFQQLVEAAKHIVVIQADNPDGDSLGSALALEEILGDLGKEVHLYCGVDIPDYLKHLNGWDRVHKEMPTNFDLSIVVDTSANVLLAKLAESQYRSWVASRPAIIIDHHSGVVCDIPFATVIINDDEAVATSEAIYKIADKLNWKTNLQAKSMIMSAILSDSLGLSSASTTPHTYRVMADLLESGVDRGALDEARREMTKMPLSIYSYKAKLISRTRIAADGKLATVVIPHEEITTYSPLYNPAPLIQGDMLQVQGVEIALVLKQYPGGKLTGSLRSSTKAPISSEIAKLFGGGGHVYASGFKIGEKGNTEVVLQTVEDFVNDHFAPKEKVEDAAV
jgi:phosphoesterase RecJ-like protein